MTSRRRDSILVCVALAAAVFLVFWPQRTFEFVLYDDPDYVTSNFQVQAGLTWSGFVWAFRAGHADNWHPLTWLSHMLDAQLFGPGPRGPHLVNLLLHVANTLILFVVLQKITKTIWRSAFVAALFALHPLHVESVAWVSERKDVLSAFFFTLTLWAYVRFVEDLKDKNGKSKLFYVLAISFFCLGLLSKPMLVTLPFVLLLLDFWPLRRCELASVLKFDSIARRLILEKTPFLMLSAAASIVTFLVQKNAREILSHLPLGTRLENALVSCARYLAKAFFPINLSVLYPYPDHWPWVTIIAVGTLVLFLTVAAIWTRRSRPYFLMGWFWFLGMLIPVIGLVQVGEQSMADRYSYLPSIGIFVAFAWGGSDLMERIHFPRIAIAVAGTAILAACMLRTSDQLRYWSNSEALFRHAIAVTENNYSAYIDLGSALSAKHLDDQAVECFNKAIAINPKSSDAYNNLGAALVKQSKTSDAEKCFQKAVEIQPRNADALNNLGVILAREGNVDEATKLFEKSIGSKPDFADAYNNLGQVLAATGHTNEAINCYRTVLKLAPNFAGVRNNLAVQLSRQGKYEEAVIYYDQELQMNPDQPQVRFNFGNVLALLGRREEAIVQFKEAIRLKPDFNQAKEQLSVLGLP